MKLLLLIILTVGSASCSMVKRKCEATDWFSYGKKVALKGTRLSSDQFYQLCHKKEAEIDEMSADQGFKEGMSQYCEKDSPFNYGKKGLKYNFNFCGHLNVKEMKANHLRGVRVYCQPSNGHDQGIKGEPYNQLCPVDMEKAFLKTFNKGRIKFLKAEVLGKESQVEELISEIREKERELSHIRSELRDINRYYDRNQRVIILPGSIIISPRSRKELSTAEEVDSEKSRIESDMRSLQQSIRYKESQIRSLRAEKRDFEKEIILLSD